MKRANYVILACLIASSISHANLLSKNDGIATDNGIGGIESFSAGVQFTTNEMVGYSFDANEAIESVQIGFHVDTAVVNFKIWQQDAATGWVGVYTQALGTVTKAPIGSSPVDWMAVTLDTPYTIDQGKNLLVGYEIVSGGADYPAGVDAGPAVDGGDLISLDGATWVSMSTEYDLNYNWLIDVKTVVPEPSTTVLAALVATAAFGIRRIFLL